MQSSSDTDLDSEQETYPRGKEEGVSSQDRDLLSTHDAQ